MADRRQFATPGLARSRGSILRSIGAVLAGYLVTVLLVVLTLALASVVTGVGIGAVTVSAGYMAINLVGSLLAAMAGGWVAARLAHGAPERHVAALALLVLLLSIYSASRTPALEPRWFSWSLVLLGTVGILLGGRFALRTAS